MVGIASIRSANVAFAGSSGAKGLVAVFVGATAGIGEAAMRKFITSTVSPTVYFVGRSSTAGAALTTELQGLNPDSRIQFLQADTTLLSTVDTVTAQIIAKEKHLNLLFMSPGYMTMNGRDESPEGLDRKMVVSYYCRIRFALNLLPLLESAVATSSSARVISVLGPGREGRLLLDDLALAAPGNYSLRNVEAHTVTMTSLAFEELAQRHPGIAWIHAFPGFVVTKLSRGLPAPLKMMVSVSAPLLRCFSVPIEDSGEGFVWLATDEKFRRGLWLLDWKGESMDSRVPEGKRRWANTGVEWWGEDKRKKVWEHTESVAGRVAPAV